MKRKSDIDEAKRSVQTLFGKFVNVKLNRGRNKVKNFHGVVKEIHDNVFVVELQDALFDRLSCTYCDVLCGEVALSEAACPFSTNNG